MTKIIDGKEISKKILYEVKLETDKLLEKHEIKPGLAVIIVGSDLASQIYVKRKIETCKKLGFYSEDYYLEEKTSEKELLRLISDLNSEPSIHGILVQLPLPSHIDSQKILETIKPEKDVDGFHPLNQGYLFSGRESVLPCTPAGIIELLKRSDIQISGKNAVVVGRSNIVGKPLALLLLNENATVTICHSKTNNLSEHCLNADILIAAIGKPRFISTDMVKDGAVVIDVGMNRDQEGKLCGDVDYDPIFAKTSAITPVPGGVGPMTIALLMQNTLQAALKTIKK